MGKRGFHEEHTGTQREALTGCRLNLPNRQSAGLSWGAVAVTIAAQEFPRLYVANWYPSTVRPFYFCNFHWRPSAITATRFFWDG